MKKSLVFLGILLPSLFLLYFSLTRNPRELPSALLGKPAPHFELTSLEGESVSLDRLKGKPVVLNFWSTWCGPCLGEHQLIRKAMKSSADSDILFYSILYEDSPENAKRFLAEYGEAAPVLIDGELRTAIDYGVSGVPETFFIKRDGTIAYKHAGMLTPDLLYTQLTALTQGD
ncbi:MAG: redoxin domain-containing protein [Deltaproteobacteria bacterium]|nr:redoxin domain-containing protein [Deltaproteobacteria bacterium]